MHSALINSNLPNLKLISRGKVRDIYATSDPSALLFVASDRISAYDVVLKNGIPDKGIFLTTLSLFWFQKLAHIIPNHLITTSIPLMPPEIHEYQDKLKDRVMLVRKAEVVPLEAIVRGYLSGSAWAEYKKSGTVHGMSVPGPNLVESQKFPEPIFTPSTKAEQGMHDENISPEQAAKLIGQDLYDKISTVSIELYKAAAIYAESRGLILADTKFEFGLIPSPMDPAEKQLILIDEVFTPDSSRFWPLKDYSPGGPQPSYDKQYLRDWLVSVGLRKGLESGPEGMEGQGWTIDESVVKGTRDRYAEAVECLTRQ